MKLNNLPVPDNILRVTDRILVSPEALQILEVEVTPGQGPGVVVGGLPEVAPPLISCLTGLPDEFPGPVCCKHPHIPVSGRLLFFHQNWQKFQPSKWVQAIISQGYKIPFKKVPMFSTIKMTPLSGQYALVLQEEVQTLLQKNAIQQVQNCPQEGYYSMYFLVPKKTGDLRPILNLKPLNHIIHKATFTMESLQSIVYSLQPGDWLATIDL